MSQKEILWNEIYDVISDTPLTEQDEPITKSAFKLLESLEKDKRLTQLDLIRLRGLMESMYRLGRLHGIGKTNLSLEVSKS